MLGEAGLRDSAPRGARPNRTEPNRAGPFPPSPLPRRPRSAGGGQTGLASPLLWRAGEEAEPAAAGCFRVCFGAGKPGAQPARRAPSPGAKFRCGGSPPSPTPPRHNFPARPQHEPDGRGVQQRALLQRQGAQGKRGCPVPLSSVPKPVAGSASPKAGAAIPPSPLHPSTSPTSAFLLGTRVYPFGAVARGGDDRVCRN